MTVTESRGGLLSRAADVARADGFRWRDLRAYFRRYFQHVAPDDLTELGAESMARIAAAHREAGHRVRRGDHVVRVRGPLPGTTGEVARCSGIDIVVDDMPFLVDSVAAELARQGLGIHLVVHPTFVVQRDEEGRLRRVLDAGPDADGPTSGDTAALLLGSGLSDAEVESWIHVEVDRIESAGRARELEVAIGRVLDDVEAAVEDWPQMRSEASRIGNELRATPPAGLVAEARAGDRLLRWLEDDNFTFLGYREYDLVAGEGGDVLEPVPGTGLGILRDVPGSRHTTHLGRRAAEKAREHRVLILTKANSRSTVHRNSFLDYIGVKKFDLAGNVTGERRFLGLFTSSLYTQSVFGIPVIDAKVKEVLARSGFRSASHSARNLITILETFPREELFQAAPEALFETVMAVQHLQERHRTWLFLRRDPYERFVTALVYLPRDRFTTGVRLHIEDILRRAFDAPSVDCKSRVSDSVLARLYFVARVAPGEALPEVDADALRHDILEATRDWAEDLRDALVAHHGQDRGGVLAAHWARAFPAAYREVFTPADAVADLDHLAELWTPAPDAPDSAPAPGGDASAAADAVARDAARRAGLVVRTYGERAGSPVRRMKVYRTEQISLTTLMPLFRNFDVEVTDERPFALVEGGPGEAGGGRAAYVYDFGLRFPDEVVDRASAAERLSAAFAADWTGWAESDGLDRLVLRTGLGWRQVMVLRALARYLRQVGFAYSTNFIARSLAGAPDVTRALLELFATRFDPDLHAGDPEGRDRAQDEIRGRLDALLDRVPGADADHILRTLRDLVLATVRTNYYRVTPAGLPHGQLVFKFAPATLEILPEPRPRHEIWVYSPRAEGVHLRFGDVARGGVRWSDRREDFRTEILGLVRAQVKKNAVIVPTGAKGGFFAKHLPDPARDREAWLAEGRACYTEFVEGLLDVTDDQVVSGGVRRVVGPARVVRHDGDDSYLVVAADKGTASFSDLANDIARQRGFWLGDAFASGGSNGYDHKAMGITARGAWESVARHFRELGVDVATRDFTVVGIGDMSGDVFGNGMLLSHHIRLVAAFDHRHLFVDPDPDPESGWAERRRLFDLPSSSWDDYDRGLISPGGGVWPRDAKWVPVSPEAARALGLDPAVGRLSAPDLVRAILAAPVDLLWNGGIGTFVRASDESDAQAGDRTNDAVRITGAELRVRVVGEGGNLGLTQRARVEAALRGGPDGRGVRLNTDAVDNSAGVDTSDREVNVKILLDQVVAEGGLPAAARNELLHATTGSVAGLVVADNYEQDRLLGLEQFSPHMLPAYERFVARLVADGRLDPDLECLPDDEELDRRRTTGRGLTAPELSTLLSYAKIVLADQVLASPVPDEAWTGRVLRGYFPPEVSEPFADRLARHPLARRIVATHLAGELVDHAGITFEFRAEEETGASPAQVVRAYAAVREIVGLPAFYAAVRDGDNVVSTDAQALVCMRFRQLVDRATRWVVQNQPGLLDVPATVARFAPVVSALRPRLAGMLRGSGAEAAERRLARATDAGLPGELARRYATLLQEYVLLDVTEIAEDLLATRAGDPAPAPGALVACAARVAEVYLALADRYDAATLLDRIGAMPRADRWQVLARQALRSDFYTAMNGLTRAVFAGADASAVTDPEPLGEAGTTALIDAWERANTGHHERARRLVRELGASESGSVTERVALVVVALEQLRGVARATARSGASGRTSEPEGRIGS